MTIEASWAVSKAPLLVTVLNSGTISIRKMQRLQLKFQVIAIASVEIHTSSILFAHMMLPHQPLEYILKVSID